MRRVVILGRGPAGLLAAARLTELGAEVTVLATAQGTLAEWSGMLDFAPGVGTGAGDPWRALPGHVGASGHFGRDWQERDWHRAWRWLLGWWRALGVTDRTEPPETNQWTVNAVGGLRRSFVVPSWQWSAAEPPRAAILLTVPGVTDFDARWVGARLAAERGAVVSSGVLTPPPAWTPSWTALRWAAWLDGAEGETWLRTAAAKAVEHLDGPRPPADAPLLIPQVLGIERTQALRAAVSEATGHPAYEVSLPPPSIGGLRLERALTDALRHRGVILRAAAARGLEDDAVVCDRGEPVGYDGLVVATGGILGGGLIVDPDGSVRMPLTGDTLGRVDGLAEALRLGLAPDDRRFAVAGRALAGCDPERDGDGGALLVYTALLAAARTVEAEEALPLSEPPTVSAT
jgi:glycerol-3-phosphate dehydrogenase subunit B